MKAFRDKINKQEDIDSEMHKIFQALRQTKEFVRPIKINRKEKDRIEKILLSLETGIKEQLFVSFLLMDIFIPLVIFQCEIDNIKGKLQELEKQNDTITQSNDRLEEKYNEIIKKMEKFKRKLFHLKLKKQT